MLHKIAQQKSYIFWGKNETHPTGTDSLQDRDLIEDSGMLQSPLAFTTTSTGFLEKQGIIMERLSHLRHQEIFWESQRHGGDKNKTPEKNLASDTYTCSKEQTQADSQPHKHKNLTVKAYLPQFSLSCRSFLGLNKTLQNILKDKKHSLKKQSKHRTRIRHGRMLAISDWKFKITMVSI